MPPPLMGHRRRSSSCAVQPSPPPRPLCRVSSGLVASKTDAAKIRRQDYSTGVDSVYRGKPGDPKQRVWFAFDNAIVLPEYLVECVYETFTPSAGPLPPSATRPPRVACGVPFSPQGPQ